jgi:hypothetical protein
LLESQHRLWAELRSHTSLLHTFRCVDPKTSVQLLGYLRRGDYDGALLCAKPSSSGTAFGDSVYPWEGALHRIQSHQEHPTDMLPPINTFLPMHNGVARYSILQPVVEIPGLPQGQNPGSGASIDISSATWAQSLDSQHVWLRTKIDIIPSYDQKSPTY